MRTNLSCPFAEKDQAKALGAKWDAAARVWYVEDGVDLARFGRWLGGGSAPAAKTRHKRKKPGKVRPGDLRGKDSACMGVTTGEVRYLCACDVLPWEDCEHTAQDDEETGRFLRGILRESTGIA